MLSDITSFLVKAVIVFAGICIVVILVAVVIYELQRRNQEHRQTGTMVVLHSLATK